MKKFLLNILILLFSFSSCTINMQEEITNNKKELFIGTWINYNEIYELLRDTRTEDDLISKVDEILDSLLYYKINNLFLHTRAFDDAFYDSNIFPKSKYSHNASNEFVDVLSIFIDCGHKRNIKIHAWINPFRISNQNDIQAINQELLSKEILSSDLTNERIIISNNGIYYNPIFIENQQYIISGIKEIIDNYNVDGIHFDDYFYPTTKIEIDKSFYEQYCLNGGKIDINNLRRDAVNSLIASTYSLCKQKGIIFSISPTEDIDKNYNEYYADVAKWVNEKGYADYIIPQIYYGFEHETKQFEKCIQEWKNLNIKENVLIGIPMYKTGQKDSYALSGENEWLENTDIISRQINMILDYGFDGFVYYSASELYGNSPKSEKEKENILELYNSW